MSALRIARHQPCRLLASGSAFPERLELDNEAVIRLVSPEGRRGPRGEEEIRELAAALSETLGVRRRRWSHRPGVPHGLDEETTVDLQIAALSAALAAAEPGLELAAVIATTSTPPRVTAGCAPAVAARLGLRCAAFDLRAGCAGGLHALVQGALLCATSGGSVAVVAGDTFSKLIPPGVPVAALAMGDGAAAFLLGPEEGGAGLISACLDADGSLGHLGTSPSPFPPSHAAIDEGRYLLTGDPEELGRRAPPLYAAAAREALTLAGLGPEAVDLMIPQQAGRALCEEVGRLVGLPRERVLCQNERHANIGSASVLVALHEAIAEGRLRRGQRVLLAALGGGLCWAAALLEL